jgi:hypothetical protein
MESALFSANATAIAMDQRERASNQRDFLPVSRVRQQLPYHFRRPALRSEPVPIDVATFSDERRD